MSGTWAVVPGLLVAAVFAVSAVAKLHDDRPAAASFEALGLPEALTRSIVPRALPVVELLLAAALVFAPGIGYAVAAVLAVVLCAAYLLVVARAARERRGVECRCFGGLTSGVIGPQTMARNALLLGIAVLALADALGDALGGVSIASRVTGAASDTWAWLAMLVLAVGLTTLVVRGEASPPPIGQPVTWVGRPIPRLTVTDPDGHAITLRDLARTGAHVFVSVSPGCPSCREALPAVTDFAAGTPEISVCLVSPSLLTEPTGIPTLLDPADVVAQVFQLSAPGAVVLGADGLIAAGPASGAEALARLLLDVHEVVADGGSSEF